MRLFDGTPRDWNQLISKLPGPHFLQTWEWAQIKESYGWIPLPLVWLDHQGIVVAAAMVLKRQLIKRGFAAHLSILYVPKGPLLDWRDAALWDKVLNDLKSFARKEGGIFLKIDPDVQIAQGVPGTEDDVQDAVGQFVESRLRDEGWRYSSDQIQFQNTIQIELSPSEEDLLANMKQKTRYNIRLAERKGVSVRIADMDELPDIFLMYAETSVRDGFVVRDENYYLTVWRRFMETDEPTMLPLVAVVEGQPVAGLMLFIFADRAYYVYGMSRELHREKMPTHLLQWEAMKQAKSRGCRIYDLWGAPVDFKEMDPLRGVFRFKAGFGGKVVRTLGAYDYAPNPLWYKLYAEFMPRILDVMRSRGRKITKQIIGDA